MLFAMGKFIFTLKKKKQATIPKNKYLFKKAKVTVKWEDCPKIVLSGKPLESRKKLIIAARYNITHISEEKMAILMPSLR